MGRSIAVKTPNGDRKTEDLVTVLMPVYNSPDVFAAIRSVLSQDYGAIELVVVDDASEHFATHAVETFIESRAGENLRSFAVLQNENNVGTVRTMNRGLRVATGKYVVSLAGDDMLCDERVLSDWVKAFRLSGDRVITARRANYDRQMTRELSTSPSEKVIRMLREASPEKVFDAFCLECWISGASTAYDRTLLEEYGAYDEHCRLIEDYPLYLRVLRNGERIGFLDRVVVRYRGGGCSAEIHNVSVAFEQDSEWIYQNEILPYARDRRQVAKRHKTWQKDLRFDRRYANLRQQYGKSRIARAALDCAYYIYHPVRALRAARNFVRMGGI